MKNNGTSAVKDWETRALCMLPMEIKIVKIFTLLMLNRYTHVLDYLVKSYPDRDITLFGEIYGVQDLKYDGQKDMLLI